MIRHPSPRPLAAPLRAALLAALALLPSALANDIGLAPPRLELVGEPGEVLTASAIVLTEAADGQEVQVEVADFALDLDGSVVVLPPGSLPTSAAGWLEPESDGFVLEPGSQRAFRLDVAVPDDPALAGTYEAMVFFTVRPPPSETSGIGVVTTTRIGLAVYVTIAGTEEGGAELVDLYLEEGTIVPVVANLGNTVMRLGGGVEIRDASGSTVAVLDLPDVPVMRGAEREVALALPDDLPPGFYVALALVEDDRGGLLAGELPFEIE